MYTITYTPYTILLLNHISQDTQHITFSYWNTYRKIQNTQFCYWTIYRKTYNTHNNLVNYSTHQIQIYYWTSYWWLNNKSGDNIEKIWAYRFLAKPKTFEAGGLGEALSPQGVQGDALEKRVCKSPKNLVLFLIKQAKTVIVRVNIG